MTTKKAVWKYVLKGPGDHHLTMPVGANILSVAEQWGFGAMWALVDPQAPQEVRRFQVVATGEVADLDGYNYVGTFQLRNDPIFGVTVWHVFAATQ